MNDLHKDKIANIDDREANESRGLDIVDSQSIIDDLQQPPEPLQGGGKGGIFNEDEEDDVDMEGMEEYDEEGGEGLDSSDEEGNYGEEEEFMQHSAHHYGSNNHITPKETGRIMMEDEFMRNRNPHMLHEYSDEEDGEDDGEDDEGMMSEDEMYGEYME